MENECISEKLMIKVRGLQNMHDKADDLDELYYEERKKLEAKYEALRNACYEERKQIISGKKEVPAVESLFVPTEDSAETVPDQRVKGFWYRCLAQIESVAELIREDDVACLEEISDITCSYSDDYKICTIAFHFYDDNEFIHFQEEKKFLTKSYWADPNFLCESPRIVKIEGCEIHWKDGINLTAAKLKKITDHENKVSVWVLAEARASFFHYFAPPKMEPATDENDSDEEDVAEIENIQASNFYLSFVEHLTIGHYLRTTIIPSAILWYTGEKLYDCSDIDEDEEAEEI